MRNALFMAAMLLLYSTGPAIAEGDSRDGRLVSIGPPVYPAYCFRKNLEAYVDFVFVVNAKGRVQNETVTDTLVYRGSVDRPVDDERARTKFIAAARKALAQYRYEPRVDNNMPVATAGVKSRITFALED